MMFRPITLFIMLYGACQLAYALPEGFVYLDEVAPNIIEDIRYAGHSRGSTVDITLVKIHQHNTRIATQKHHKSINMGTRFDYFDKRTHVFYQGLNQEQLNNRLLLRHLMVGFNFIPYNKEWWHFTLRDEPYPRSYFNFLVR